MLFDVALTLLQGRTKGQIGRLLHVFMPGMFLTGLLGAKEGTLALIPLSLIFSLFLAQNYIGGSEVKAKLNSSFS